MESSSYNSGSENPSSNGNISSFNSTRVEYMNSRSSEVGPLILYGVFSVFGSTINIFEISSLIVQETLCRRGNVLLVNQALANLLVSAVSFPVMCVAILAGLRNEHFICEWEWHTALACFLVTVMNYLCISVENYLQTCRKEGDLYDNCFRVQLILILILTTWVAAISFVTTLFVLQRGPNLCQENFEDSSMLFVFFVPVFLTITVFAKAVYEQRNITQSLSQQNSIGSREEILQRHLLNSNVVAFTLFLCFWLPFLISLTLHSMTSVPPISTIHQLFTLAQIYSCVCGIVYALIHDSFRQGYIYLIRYLCFKTHGELSKLMTPEKTRGTVRVHIGMETRVGDRSRKSTRIPCVISHYESSSSKCEEDFL
ncbi:uncharacterized protein LOC106469620 [Limulus polyphemus]|uniref:Uncharacterized protein LOC106469620 n=1 Tax=Limulus polyphemus TaxID=6850 RepID=A0ABM1TG57_LIMPO|nr:uncharacterized protein LOC106469620 [Limulus polyphemus]XP_022254863.1 uncharacterized protein LOC106469620 [Limulus polyphemus]